MRDAGVHKDNPLPRQKEAPLFSGQQMWLNYQKVSSKMSSFDPRELGRTKDTEVIKHPLKRFEPTLRKSLSVVIPMNLDRLKKHRVNVEKYMQSKQWKELNVEEINASRTVQQLKATIRELDNIRHQLQEEDVDDFDKQIAAIKAEVQHAIEEFCSLDATGQTNTVGNENSDADGGQCSSSKCDDTSVRKRLPSTTSTFAPASDDTQLTGSVQDQILHPLLNDVDNEEEAAALQSWDNLKNGLIDLDSLVKDFAACVHQQQEMVDNIEDNIEATHHNVNAAASLLGQASKYKAAMVPVAGAVVGGLVAGPIGLLAGFKLAGAVAAVGGSLAGYQGGKIWKKKHDKNVEMELAHLSRPEKNQ